MNETAAPLVPAEAAELSWHIYEQRKAAFLAANPSASSDEIEAFCQQLVEEVGL